ncbi:MAG: creatininase family protein [Chloroflexota bacterium]
MARWLHEMKWPEVAEYLKTEDTVLIPAGTTEQHSRHLPLQVDAAEAIDLAVEVSNRTGIVITPPLYIGWSPHHMGFPGTLTLRWDTVTHMVEDIGYSLAYHGFKKFIFIQARGGHVMPFQEAQVKIVNRTGAYMVIVDVAYVARKEVGEICAGVDGAIGHACEAETSHMLYLHPELVDMSKAVRHVVVNTSKYEHNFAIHNPYRADSNSFATRATIEEATAEMGPAGGMGDPLLASKEKGQRIFEALVTNTLEIIEMARKRQVTLKPIDVPL